MNVKRRATAGAVAWRFRVAESRVEARPKLSVPIKECERPKSSEDEIKNLGDERIKCMLRGYFFDMYLYLCGAGVFICDLVYEQDYSLQSRIICPIQYHLQSVDG